MTARAKPLTYAQQRELRTTVRDALAARGGTYNGTLRRFAEELVRDNPGNPIFTNAKRTATHLSTLKDQKVLTCTWQDSQAFDVVASIQWNPDASVDPPQRRHRMHTRRSVATKDVRERRRMEILAYLEARHSAVYNVTALARGIQDAYGIQHDGDRPRDDIRLLESAHYVGRSPKGDDQQIYIFLTALGLDVLRTYRGQHNGEPATPPPDGVRSHQPPPSGDATSDGARIAPPPVGDLHALQEAVLEVVRMHGGKTHTGALIDAFDLPGDRHTRKLFRDRVSYAVRMLALDHRLVLPPGPPRQPRSIVLPDPTDAQVVAQAHDAPQYADTGVQQHALPSDADITALIRSAVSQWAGTTTTRLIADTLGVPVSDWRRRRRLLDRIEDLAQELHLAGALVFEKHGRGVPSTVRPAAFAPEAPPAPVLPDPVVPPQHAEEPQPTTEEQAQPTPPEPAQATQAPPAAAHDPRVAHTIVHDSYQHLITQVQARIEEADRLFHEASTEYERQEGVLQAIAAERTRIADHRAQLVLDKAQLERLMQQYGDRTDDLHTSP